MLIEYPGQMGKAMSSAVCSSSTASRAVGRAILLPVHPGSSLVRQAQGYIPQGEKYELVSLPIGSKRSRTNDHTSVCFWPKLMQTYTPNSLVQQGHWLCCADMCRLSMLVLLSCTASRCSYQSLADWAQFQALRWVGPMTQVTYPGTPGSVAKNTPHLMTCIRQTCTPLIFPCQSAPPAWFCR